MLQSLESGQTQMSGQMGKAMGEFGGQRGRPIREGTSGFNQNQPLGKAFIVKLDDLIPVIKEAPARDL